MKHYPWRVANVSSIALVARGGAYEDKKDGSAEADISTSGDWAQDESLIGLLAQNPYFNDDTVRDFNVPRP